MNVDSETALLENAVDSLRFGLEVFLKNDSPTAPKHAIRAVWHSIELLLKERLRRVHPLLIFQDLKKPISEKSMTVGIEETFARLKNAGVNVGDAELRILRDLKQRRNQIEHFRFTPDDSHRFILGKALRFVHDFFEKQLGSHLEEHLPDPLYRKAREQILGYDERLKLAREEVSRWLAEYAKHGPPRFVFPCADCSNMTVLMGTAKGNFCFFCRKEIDHWGKIQCEECGNWFYHDDLVKGCTCKPCAGVRQWVEF